MKLYLSSYKLGNHPEKLTAMVGSNKKAAVIANAMDFLENFEVRKGKVKAEVDVLKVLGFLPEEVDLRDYFGKPEELARKMSEFGLVWVRGGNAFLLLRAYIESGMDKWLIDQKDNKQLVYGGYSAGCVVLSPTMEGVDIVDDPNTLAPGYKPEIIWSGLGLIDYSFVPHFESEHLESEAVGRVVVYLKENNINFKAIHDGEVIISET
jgi:dipeptidase E